ncbi:hypothetical protein Fcan01_10699 [Folsomia candida]|uniref:Uncharacterized protein n=1 Tax=Folsomia candida TaxID=158441 RepID=A0A226E872_FOLCA|nr:hypothetical protein Fcan01_10699 [Folsomia candida]
MFLRFERTLWGKQCPAEFRKLGRYLSYSLWVLVFEGSIAAALLVFVIILVQRIPFLGSLIPEMHDGLTTVILTLGHVTTLAFQTWQFCTLITSLLLVAGNVLITTIFSLFVYVGHLIK